MLLDHGHPDASLYPVHLVWEESYLVLSRLNATIASEAVLIKLAIHAALDNDANKDFTETIKGLTDG